MTARWFFPSWSGDFRLEAAGEGCILRVEDPTPGEIDRLTKLLKRARSKGWIEQHLGIATTGETKLTLNVPLAKAGLLLLDRRERKGLKVGKLTAVLSTAGTVTTFIDNEQQAVEAPEAVEAVSVRRPTLCCPNPVTGPDRRASEVLRTFCTPRQWRDWLRDGLVRCWGNLSGRLYEVVHRHNPLAVRRGKCAWDVEAGRPMHAYDWAVPPAEEVLVLKLVLEHREDWIRNESGALRFADEEQVYRNPFMPPGQEHLDGTDDSMTVGGVAGGLIAGLIGMR